MFASKEFRLVLALVVIVVVQQMCSFPDAVDNLHNAIESWADRPPLGIADPTSTKKPPPGSNEPGGSQAGPGDFSPTPFARVTSTPSGFGSGLKPVCFLNTGTIGATVMAWTFLPPYSDTFAAPSDASTVAFPGGNPSACLSLPLGTYTWCYHWEIGDVNGDGYMEYSHTIDNRPVILDENDSDDLDLAEHVGIVAPTGMYEYPGQCPVTANVIGWGSQSTFWRVELEGGIVVGGSAGGSNYYNWTIQSGTFDGETLYFYATTADVQGCKSQIEAWWTVTASSVSSIRVRDGCGTESTEVHTFPRTE